MKWIVFAFIVAVAFVLLSSCQKNVSFTDNGTTPDTMDTLGKPPAVPVIEQMITTSVMGKILDEKEEPMKDATVSAAGKITTTDEYGIFRLKDVTVPQFSAFISIEKTGYLRGSRTISAESGGNAFIRVKMVKKILKATFEADAGATVMITGTASVTFDAAVFRNRAGAAYHGKVFVYGTFYDPAAVDFDEIMPGTLRGLTVDSQATALKSYGMLNVVMETESGEALELSAGKQARIGIPVSSTLLSGAPAEIPLWHFSETDGKWREEGKAVLRDGVYHGAVSHFSTWNVDAPYTFAFIKFKVRAEKGLSVPYAKVVVTDKTSGNYGTAYSDSLGWVTIQVPRNQPLEIKVINECGKILGSRDAAAVTGDKQVDPVFINPDDIIGIYGTVVACNGITSGIVSVYTGGLTYTSEFRDGQFYALLSECWKGVTQARMGVYDPAYTTASAEKIVEITGTVVDAGNFDLCGNNFTQYAHIKVNEDSIILTAPPDIVRCGLTYDSLWQIGFTDDMNTIWDVTELRMEFPGTQVGERLSTYCVLSYVNVHPILSLYTVDGRPETLLHVKVTQAGPVGTYIKFTFEGMLFDAWASTWIPVSGEVSALRTF